jgi:hypothetical protein
MAVSRFELLRLTPQACTTFPDSNQSVYSPQPVIWSHRVEFKGLLSLLLIRSKIPRTSTMRITMRCDLRSLRTTTCINPKYVLHFLLLYSRGSTVCEPFSLLGCESGWDSSARFLFVRMMFFFIQSSIVNVGGGGAALAAVACCVEAGVVR